MKKTIFCILIILLLIAAGVYYHCMQKEQWDKETKEAVAAAVQQTIDSINQHKALEIPEQQVIAHKPPPPPPQKIKPKAEPIEPDMLVDERDGNKYKVFEANGNWWMGENLNFETPDSWCYELAPENCQDWGRLYTWDAANKACPNGWHLPNDEEWLSLISYYGGNHYAGKELKAGGASEFNALLSGYRDKAGYFGKLDESAYYWSSTSQNDEYASFKGVYKTVDNIGTYTYTKPDGLSVRCIKDK